MTKVDWSKPIEVYDPSRRSTPACPAAVITTGLVGGYLVGIRRRNPVSVLIMEADDNGYIPGYSWRIRNAPTQVTKYLLVLKDPKGENQNDNKVVVLYSTYEKAEADCTGKHKIVEVTYEL